MVVQGNNNIRQLWKQRVEKDSTKHKVTHEEPLTEIHILNFNKAGL